MWYLPVNAVESLEIKKDYEGFTTIHDYQRLLALTR